MNLNYSIHHNAHIVKFSSGSFAGALLYINDIVWINFDGDSRMDIRYFPDFENNSLSIETPDQILDAIVLFRNNKFYADMNLGEFLRRMLS